MAVNKVTFKMPQRGFCGGIEGDFKKNTQIVAPENHFGILLQDDKPLQCFNDSVVLNAKSVKELKVPFFGKVKNVKVRFFPYGVTGNYIADNYAFELKSGAKSSATFKIAYTTEIENPMSALNIEKLVCPNGLKSDGSLTTPVDFNEYVVKSVLDEIIDYASQNKPWTYDPGIRGIKYTLKQINDNIYVETGIYAKAKNVLKELGYKLTIDFSKTTIGNIDLLVRLNK